MIRNFAGQKFRVFALDSATGRPKINDQANITAYLSKDGGAVTALADTSATQLDATNAPGWYEFDAALAEIDFHEGLLTGKSTTSGVDIIGRVITTQPLALAHGTGVGVVAGGATATSIPLSSFSPSGASVDRLKGKEITFINTTMTAGLRDQSATILNSTNADPPTLTLVATEALSVVPAAGDIFFVS